MMFGPMMIVGAAIAILGFLCSDTIYDLVTGETSLSDLVKGDLFGGFL